MVRPNEMRKHRRRGLRWFLLILMLVSELMAYAWVRTESTQAILRIARLQQGIQQAISYRKALGIERDRLKSEARITRIAKESLGLSSDIFNQTIYLTGAAK